MNKIIIVVILAFSSLMLSAQDDIKVMQYNLLNYGNITSYCTASNNNMATKEAYLRKIINYVNPDVFTVNELAGNTYVIGRLLDSVMNNNPLKTYGKADYINTNGSDLVNMLFYNEAKLVYVGAESLQNHVRDIVLYKLYYKSPNLAQSHDTAWINFIVGHLKAGSSSSDKADRNQMTADAITYLVAHNYHGNYTFMGDFNIRSSNEQSYKNLTNATDINYRFFDPINRPGNWNNSSSYADIHTQSTHSSGNGCAAGGGCDDRFDFILISNDLKQANAHVNYVNNSYKVIGNDGNHFNQSINSGTNNSAPANIIDALYHMSDHMPVYLELHFDAQVSAIAKSDKNSIKVNFQNPVDGDLDLYIESDGQQELTVELWSINGQIISNTNLGRNMYFHAQIPMQNLSNGMYFVRIKNASGENIYSAKVIK
jgi:hypothetical protein